MNQVSDFLKRAAERNGFVRDRFEERKLPTDVNNIAVLPLFADLRGTFIAASLVVNRCRQELRGSKYFVVAGWPGLQSFFPYADEYWSLADDSQLGRFYSEAEGFENRSDLATVYQRNLNEFFRDVIQSRDFRQYYDNGIAQGYFDTFRHIKRTLPLVPSTTILGKDFNREIQTKGGFKVFVYPALYAKQWRQGRSRNLSTSREFWRYLIERLIREGMVPVVWKGPFCHDLSEYFTNEPKCIYFAEKDMGRVLGVMRMTGCVLDCFTGISRLAIAARCPFVSLDERSRWAEQKEYEIDDLCATGLPYQYIFSFSTILGSGVSTTVDSSAFVNVVQRLHEFLPSLNRDEWPSTGESTEIVPYHNVRLRKTKRIGARLLKIPNRE